MPSIQKDTIYIDIDDEITAIIDKVQASKQKIVALVLPKRATVLQSIVNMKLLKRTAENAKKHIVLITTESGLLPLAGAVGLHVASSLQSKPVIPPTPETMNGPVSIDDTTETFDDFDPNESSAKTLGELTGATAVAPDEVETIELDNSTTSDNVAGAASTGAAAALASKVPKLKKNSKLRVPDFNKFRLAIILGAVLIVGLLIFGYFAAFVLPKATVTIATDSSDVETNLDVTLDPKQTDLDPEERVLPAKIEQKQQTGSQQVVASGSKNKGTKATGEVKIINCTGGEDLTIPAGTGVSTGSTTYITQESVTLPVESKTCKDLPGATSKVVDVTAISPGTKYNIGAQSSLTVAGQGSTVKASSSDPMTGGTDNIVKVVSQTDVDTAKQKITQQDSTGIKNELASKLSDEGYLPVTSSLKAGDPTVTTSANVGDEADTVTVTSATAYTMYGVHKEDVEQLVLGNVKDKIDDSKQKILSTGVDKADFDINSPATSGPLHANLSATSLAGPDIKTDELKSKIKGLKTNDVRTIVTATPGVESVDIKYSPFWVSKVPNKEAKITIVIVKSSANATKP